MGLDALVQAKELAKKETENPTGAAAAAGNNAAAAAADKMKEFDPSNIESFPQEKELSEKIYNEISKKDGVLAKQYQRKYEEIVNAVNSDSGNDKLTGALWHKLQILNRLAISEIVRSNVLINERLRARISSTLNSISIKDTVNTMNPAMVAVV